ncbi:MAG TPA: ATP-binding cassette domain-containing protein [Gaiellaceae bacterium]|jgi:ABC-2 type transport system ATP-binding protein
MSRTLVSVAALATACPALLWLAPTAPPRAPLRHLASAPVGLAAGIALFLLLAHARPRILLTPTAFATALVVAAVGTSEEAIWRAFALGRIAPNAGLWAAVAVTSAAFAATHLPTLRLRGTAIQLGTGTVFGVLFAATGSLVACALAHAAYNVLAVLSRRVPATAAIELRGAEKRFHDRVALQPFDVSVEPGELLALLGPNGAGKTTLVSLIVGLRRPSGGVVRIFGRDPRDWRARSRLGTTPQQMDFPPTLRGREILELARAHSASAPPLAVLAERFGLDDLLRQQNGALSGGQRRRLALALAFANDPDLVVLDEPTTGLDVESRRGAWEAIGAFTHAGGTVLLTTHSIEEADALARRVVVLARGRLVADGPLADIKSPADAGLEEAFLRITR